MRQDARFFPFLVTEEQELLCRRAVIVFSINGPLDGTLFQ